MSEGTAGSRGSWERQKEGPSPEREVEGYTPPSPDAGHVRAVWVTAFAPSRYDEEGRSFDRWLLSERARIWDEGAREVLAKLSVMGSKVSSAALVNPYRKGESA